MKKIIERTLRFLDKWFPDKLAPVFLIGGSLVFMVLYTPLLETTFQRFGDPTMMAPRFDNTKIAQQEYDTCKMLMLRKRFRTFDPASRCSLASANEPRQPIVVTPEQAKGHI